MDPSHKCYLRNENFIVYASIFAFVIPLLIMILMFILTVRSLRLQLQKLENYSPIRKKNTKTDASYKFDSAKSELIMEETKRTNKQSIKSSFTNETKIPKKICFPFEKENFSSSSLGSVSQIESIIKNGNRTPELLADTEAMSLRIKLKKYKRKLGSSKMSMSQNCNTKLYMQNEIKAVKVLGVVFACFLVSWLPFCLINIGSVICSIYKIEIIDLNHILNYLTYIGYISSTFNPIIYTAFNKKFRQNFVEILKCTIK